MNNKNKPTKTNKVNKNWQLNYKNEKRIPRTSKVNKKRAVKV